MSELSFLFKPKNIAVIGASRHPEKLGFMVLSNIKKHGFKGSIYPVNPKTPSILGLKSYESVLDIRGSIDLVVISVPSEIVTSVLDEAGRKGVKAAIIITAGFREMGSEGAEREKKVIEIGAKYNMRILGPNCLGLINTYSSLNASFAESMPEKQNIAVFSQSGAMCTAILDWANASGIGFSKFISLGNKADITESDLLETFLEDDKSDVILGYLEGIEDGERFLKAAKKITRKKPLVIIKSGSSDEGSRAISSHTGSLAGFDKATEAAFKKAGIIRALTIQDLFDASKIFSLSSLPRGGNVTVVTNAGGPGVMTSDFIDENELLSMTELSEKTGRALKKSLPETSNVKNPIDVIGDAKADRYEKAIEATIYDAKTDIVLVLLTPQVMTETEKTANVILKLQKRTDKPIVGCFMGGNSVKPGITMLEKGGIPVFGYPMRAIKALEYLVTYANHVRHKDSVSYKRGTYDAEAAKEIINNARDGLMEAEVTGILGAYGIPIAESLLVKNIDAAKRAANKIGYPVVLKIASPDILHKTDVGGVKINIKNVKEVELAYKEIIQNVKKKAPKATIKGVTIFSMVEDGQEVIIGAKRDDIFGPMVVFGLGGVYVEILKDVIFQICPVTKEDAMKMIMSIRASGLLTGYRGQWEHDIDAIADAIVRVSDLMLDIPEIRELDINPLRVYKKGEGAKVLDAKIIL